MSGINGSIVWVLVAVAVVWLLLRQGRRQGHGHGGIGGHGGSHHRGTHVQQPTSRSENRPAPRLVAAVDPVNGKAVRTDQALTSVYAGRTYYFESEDTRRRFEAEPERHATSAPPPERRARRRGC